MDIREIYELYNVRKQKLAPAHLAALNVKQAYYGDIVLPLPEMDRSEKPLVANLLYQGGEQRAMRVASTMPDVQYPSTNPGRSRADQRARERRLVNLAWYDDDVVRLKMRKRARHMVFYAATPVVLRPNFRDKRPTWQVRNPLATFPPDMDVGELQPPDVIFTYTRSLAWLNKHYGPQMAQVNQHQVDTNYVCLEYMDDKEYVTAVIGDAHHESTDPYNRGVQVSSPEGEIVELERVPNLLGECPAVLAGRIGLEHARGEFDGMVGLFQAQAKMMALMVLGTQRAVYPEEWLVDNPNGEGAKVVTPADPLHGITGHISGGTLQTVHPLPEAFAMNVVNYLERAARVDAGIPAELGGESTSNVRTGKRGDAILSAVLDFPIQEEQQLLEVSMRIENSIAIGIDKAYFPTAKSIYLSSSAGMITYEAQQFWEGAATNWVKFAHAGVDAQGLPVEIGQRVGMGTLSKRSAMEIDPLIEDPQGEFDRMYMETMRADLMQSLGAMAQDPNAAPMIAEIISKARASDTEVEDAVLAVHTKMQADQAAQAQPQPGAPGPEAQPGMGAPTAIPPPAPSQQNLTALLSGLHRQVTAGQIPGG